MDGSMASRRVGHEVSAPFDAAPEAAQGGVLPLPIASQASPGWLRDAEQYVRMPAAGGVGAAGAAGAVGAAGAGTASSQLIPNVKLSLMVGPMVVLLTASLSSMTANISRVKFAVLVFAALMPFGCIALHFARDQGKAFRMAGFVWTTAVSMIFTLSVGSAFDGSGEKVAEEWCTSPITMLAVCGVPAAIGMVGALIEVSAESRSHVAVVVACTTAIKLWTVGTPAYIAMQACIVVSFAVGYLATFRGFHEVSVSRAADRVMSAAGHVREPFIVADETMRILTINAGFTELLGYVADEVVGRPITMLVADGLDASDFPRVANFLEAQVKGKAGEGGTLGCTVAALTKAGERLAVRLVVRETRCANSGIRLFTATLRHSSMSLKNRYAQLLAEKERLEWEVRSSASPRGDADDLRSGRAFADQRHRTLGAMQDQEVTDAAVSAAHSIDHVDSSWSTGGDEPASTSVLPNASPPRTPSPSHLPSTGSLGDSPSGLREASFRSVTSLASSVMDTISEAAAKDPTRAPPPPKSPDFGARKSMSVRSEPSPEPARRPRPRAVPARAPYPYEVERDPREYS